jgi:hypothetical protein
MTSIRFSGFAGMRPRINRALLSGNEAVWAENVNLWHGTIEAYRTPLPVDPRGAPHRTIFRTEAGWIVLSGVNDLVAGLPGCPRVIAVGEDLRAPVWADAADAVAGRWWRLGLPVPTSPIATPSASPRWAGPNDQRSEYRAYVVTYVDRFGNEGPPSLPSARFGIDDGAAVLVQWDSAPIGGWDVQAVRLYRLTASDAGAAQIGLPRMEEFHLVGEFPAAVNGVNDTLPNLDLGEPLTTMRFAPPPEGLTHLVAEPNGTQLAGAAGRDLWVCEPHEFHAWPDAYRLHLDDTIVALAWTDSGLYVATDGHPYWIAPQADELGRREVFRMVEPMPCVSRRSMTVTPSGSALYAGRDGLVLLHGRQSQRVSQAYWGEDDFAALRPETMLAAVHDGLWFGFTANSGWMLDLTDPAYPGRQLGLIALSLRPTALHRSRTDALFLALPTGIGQWNAGPTYLSLRYRTRCTVTPGQMNWAAAKVVWDVHPFRGDWAEAAPATTFRLWTDDRLRFERELRHSNPFRLPHLSRHLGFEIEIERPESPDKGALREIHIATSIAELAAG